MSNSLTIAVLDKKSVTVPIGVTVLTNKKVQNSLKVQVAMTGMDIHTPNYDLIEAPGYNGEQAYRTNSDDIVFDTPIDYTKRQIAEASFDDKKGALTFIRKDGTLLVATGFLRQVDFGVGPTGPRGDRGTDGYDGKDGFSPPAGPDGCAGINGVMGRTGAVGDTGAEGAVGDVGAVGPLGATGPQGDIGKMGPRGFEGKRGLCGFSCPTTSRGPCGPQGNTMSPVVAKGLYPTNLDLIWAGADDCICAVFPDEAIITPVANPAKF